MKKENSKSLPYLILFAWALAFVLISFVYINTGDFTHDYPFHLGRLSGLAQSFAQGDYLPDLNFVFIRGMGYGVPMFYGNWLFYLPALVYLIVPSAQIAYAILALILVYGLCVSMYFSVNAIGRHPKKALAAAISSSLVFTWFGYGMTMAASLVPLLVWGLYKVIFKNRLNPFLLGAVIALLIQTHILSTMILAFISFLFVLLNIRRMNWAKWGSFVMSIGMGIILATGFLVQYKIQSDSQVFFFDWLSRDYPFSHERLLKDVSLLQVIQNYSDPVMLAALACLVASWKKLSPFSRQLVILSIVLFVIQTSLVPWHTVFLYTPLALIQDASRVAFFIPVFILMAAALSWNVRANLLLAGAQFVFYVVFGLLSAWPNAENMERMSQYDQKACQAWTNPEAFWFDPSGDEYFSLDFVHGDKNQPQLSEFQDLQNVQISNIQSGYNSLEFDYQLIDPSQNGSVILPRFWYEGYVAEYSREGAGSQPIQKTRALNEEEKQKYAEALKPDTDTKVEFNGKILLEVSASGHVKVSYQKLPAAIAGFIEEGAGWGLLALYGFVWMKDQRQLRRQKFRLAIIQVRNRQMDQYRRQMAIENHIAALKEAGKVFAWRQNSPSGNEIQSALPMEDKMPDIAEDETIATKADSDPGEQEAGNREAAEYQENDRKDIDHTEAGSNGMDRQKTDRNKAVDQEEEKDPDKESEKTRQSAGKKDPDSSPLETAAIRAVEAGNQITDQKADSLDGTASLEDEQNTEDFVILQSDPQTDSKREENQENPSSDAEV